MGGGGGVKLSRWCRSEVRPPVSHQLATALEERRPRIRRLDLVLDLMGEGRFNDLPRMVRLFGRPVAETGSEAVRHGLHALLL